MVKTTKRAKKFVAKGGIQKKLKKGETFAKKGKFRAGRKNNADAPGRTSIASKTADAQLETLSKEEKMRRENDFLGDANLKGLTLSSFLQDAAEFMEKDDGADEQNAETIMEEVSSSSDEDEEQESADEEKCTEEYSKETIDASKKDKQNNDEDEFDSDGDIEADEAVMKKKLEQLEMEDPDFHQFLKQNESSLLKFGNDDNEQGQDDDGLDDDGVEDMETNVDAVQDENEGENKENDANTLTMEKLRNIEQKAFGKKYGIKALKRVVLAYKTACHLADVDDEDKQRNMHYQIESSAVFDHLMVTCLTKFHEAFHHHLVASQQQLDLSKANKNNDKESLTEHIQGEDNAEEATKDKGNEKEKKDENQSFHPKFLQKADRWDDMERILQTFFRNTIYLLQQIREAKLLIYILRKLSHYPKYMTPFPMLSKKFLKVLVDKWCSGVSGVSALTFKQSDHKVRFFSFLRIRQLALTQPFPFIEDCLKTLYLEYAKHAKFVKPSNNPQDGGSGAMVCESFSVLTFWGNCLVELYSLDVDSSYQHAFVYIRQLALHLRNAYRKRAEKEGGATVQTVYCWQYLFCLKLWTAVLVANPGGSEKDDEGLRSLFYPLVEIIQGTARLVPEPRFLPLRFHCVRLLQQLAASSRMFIPTTPFLLEVLDLKEFYLKPKKNPIKKNKGPPSLLQLSMLWKLPKDDTLRTKSQLDPCMNELFVLLTREIDLYRYSVGFPEFTIVICQRLRKFNKEIKDARWRAFSRGCIEVCEKNAAFVSSRRSLLRDAPPKSIKHLEVLKPSDADDMMIRHNNSITKEKRQERSVAVAPAPAVAKKRKAETHKTDMRQDLNDIKNQGKKTTSKETDTNKEEESATTTALITTTQPRDMNLKTQSSKIKTTMTNENLQSLLMKDQVTEGIDWSDDEDE